MKFCIGDKVKIAYINDCNPHNGKVGEITSLRRVNYYPNGDYSVVEQHVQAIIKYEDGTTEGVGDIYREGSGLVSPVEKVESFDEFDSEKYTELLERLKALEKEANERIDEIPEVFDSLQDSENYNYYQGVLETVRNIKDFLGVNEL